MLVVSADPAHSLGDSLDLTVGDQLVQVPGYPNLTALELDAAALYQQFRDQYVANVNQAFDTWLGHESGVMTRKQVQFDRELVLEYVDSYPPGVEETLFLERLHEFVEADRFDLYVLDPAPTGHLLKLLAFPELIKQWLRVTYRAIVKYQQKYAVANLAPLGERTLQSTTALRHMRKALTDPQNAELIAVTIPETMSVAELQRLLEATHQIGHATGHVVCNMLVPSSGCDFCKAKREEQLGYLEQIIRVADSRGATVTELEQFPREVRGVAALERMAAALYGNHVPEQIQKHGEGVTRQSPHVHTPPPADTSQPGNRFGVMSHLSTCQVCGGRGEVALHPPVQPCKFCGGSGVEPYSSNRLTCSACGGKGMVKAIPDGVPCPKCEGSGIDPHTRTVAMACAKCHGQGVIRPTLHTAIKE